MKVIHYSHQIGIGGTEKCMQYFLEYLHTHHYDCYCIHNRSKTDDCVPNRELVIGDVIGHEKVFGYLDENDFFRIVKRIRPDIFHIHRSGRPDEFPVVPRLKKYVKKCVETNVFGGIDNTNVIDLTLFVNKSLMKAGRSLRRPTDYLYNPVKKPSHCDSLRSAFRISTNTFVMGRIGRPDDHTFDPISLFALKEIEQKTNWDILYLIQSPPPKMIHTARNLNLEKILFIDRPMVSDSDITAYFNTIDVLAHARRDGETFGLNIAEAMIHGKPVVSHQSKIADGHKPFVKQCGYFVKKDEYKKYAKYIMKLYRNSDLLKRLGDRGRKFAEKHFLIENIGKKLEQHYHALLTN